MKIFSIISILFICNLQSFAQKNIAMYNAKDAKTYYLSTNTNYNYPFYVTDMAGSWTSFTNKIKYSYRINNNAPTQCVVNVDHNDNWNCVNAPNLSKYRIVIPTPLVFTTAGTYTLSIWIDSLDGLVDANNSNDTLVRIYKAIPNCPTRKGLIEYGYHVSCGPCGEDGTPFHERAIADYSSEAICVKLHNYSSTIPAAYAALNCPEAKIIDDMFGSTAHPDFTFNRSTMEPFDNDDKFYPKYCPADSAYFIRDLHFSNSMPVEFSFSNYTLGADNKINFTLATKFLDGHTFTKDTRMNVMLVEDSIWYYMYNNGVATIPDSIHHRYVLRKVYGNPLGDAGSLPTNVSANQIVNFVTSDSVKPSWNKKQLYLIPTIMQYGSNKSDHEILQAQLFSSAVLSAPLSIGKNVMVEKLSVYPNPTNDKINIECKSNISNIYVFSMDGKVVAKLFLSTPKLKFEIDLKQFSVGTYLLKLKDESGNVYTEKVNIVR
jgi:hypothetical protein